MTTYKITNIYKTYYVNIDGWEGELLDEVIEEDGELKFQEVINLDEIISIIHNSTTSNQYTQEIVLSLIRQLVEKFQ